MSWSGCSATSGSRLFMSMRMAASWAQPLQLSWEPCGAWTGPGLVVMSPSWQGCDGRDRTRSRSRSGPGLEQDDLGGELARAQQVADPGALVIGLDQLGPVPVAAVQLAFDGLDPAGPVRRGLGEVAEVGDVDRGQAGALEELVELAAGRG